jgi:hypothetical protein
VDAEVWVECDKYVALRYKPLLAVVFNCVECLDADTVVDVTVFVRAEPIL